MASTATFSLPCAVIITTAVSARASLLARSTSMPDMPRPSARSVITRSYGRSASMRFASSPVSARSTS